MRNNDFNKKIIINNKIFIKTQINNLSVKNGLKIAGRKTINMKHVTENKNI